MLAFAVFVPTTRPAELVEAMDTKVLILDEPTIAQEEVLKKARIEQPYMTRLCSLLGYEKLYFGGI
ncbi:hypothetical protein [Laedolimicola sp.]|uniref:hypothetical protein n=1 Tax=Laedolimicola sp. TaxID=2981663 RepID=UPI003F7D2B96